MGRTSNSARRHLRGCVTVVAHVLTVCAVALLLVSGAFHPARAQSIVDVFSNYLGTSKRKSGSHGSKKRADVVIPPIPTKQPKPWHAQTQRHPSTGPEPEWPRVLPPKVAAPAQKVTPPVPRGVQTPAVPPAPQFKSTGTATKAAPGASVEAAQNAVPSPERRPASSAPIVVQDVYTPEEIATAQARCQRILSRIDAEVVPEFPIKKGACGHPAPVKLVSIGKAPQVAIQPPAIVNCDMVEALHDWLKDDLQPLARKHLGSRIVTLENMSSYSCRNVYGRVNTRLSQHAKANALDIRGFVTRKGRVARLLEDWGPTGRDIEAFRIAQRKAEEARKALAEAKAREAEKANQASKVAGTKSTGTGAAIRSTFGEDSLSGTREPRPDVSLGLSGEAQRLGGPVPVPPQKPVRGNQDVGSVVRVAVEPEPKPAETPQALFLRAAHESACKRFGTTLGPEANNAHRNHFHVDLAPRKRSNICE